MKAGIHQSRLIERKKKQLRRRDTEKSTIVRITREMSREIVSASWNLSIFFEGISNCTNLFVLGRVNFRPVFIPRRGVEERNLYRLIFERRVDPFRVAAAMKAGAISSRGYSPRNRV